MIVSWGQNIFGLTDLLTVFVCSLTILWHIAVTFSPVTDHHTRRQQASPVHVSL